MTARSQPPSDDELDRLLQARLRRTSPEFEMRWRELRGTFATSRAVRVWPWPRWLGWPGLAAAAVVIVVLTFNPRRPGVEPTGPDTFASLVALNNALAPARPLLEAETRDAVLYLPINP